MLYYNDQHLHLHRHYCNNYIDTTLRIYHPLGIFSEVIVKCQAISLDAEITTQLSNDNQFFAVILQWYMYRLEGIAELQLRNYIRILVKIIYGDIFTSTNT